MLDLIKDLHEGTTARVRIDGTLTEPFVTASGVRQGCVLAPALFCRAMDWILERIATRNGINLPEYIFSDLDYADDVALMDASISRLVASLDHVETEASHLGLHVSWPKTKLQRLGAANNATNTADTVVRGRRVEVVSEFTYLGSTLSTDERCTPDVTRRIGLAASAMRSFHILWRQKQVKLSTKLRLYQTCILSILLYGSETWSLQTRDSQRLQSFHMRCQRQILCIRWSDFVQNSTISARTGLSSLTDMIASRRLALFGHVARMHNDIPAHGALSCAVARRTERRPPPGWKRPPGRPRHTWLQQIGDGSISTILHEWNRATGRGHSERCTRSAQRTLAVLAN